MIRKNINRTVYAGKQVVLSEKPANDVISTLEDLGKVVKFKRTSLGFTIMDTAQLSNISTKTLHNIEDGKGANLSSVLKLISMLGLKMSIKDR